MEAFKNCMTPLQVTVVLGYDDIAQYLSRECGADVNFKTKAKGYSCLHLSVLANKPEMIMDLLTKMKADPLQEDNQGRALLDMIYKYIPAYVETFQSILEKLASRNRPAKQKTSIEADDNRQITGKKTEKEI